MRAVMRCCADQKALAQFFFKLHAALERTHDQAVADIACEVCGDLGDEAHMLICSGAVRTCVAPPRRFPPPHACGRLGFAALDVLNVLLRAKAPTVQRDVLQCPVPLRAVSRAARRLHA
jgi:hypothetical protein